MTGAALGDRYGRRRVLIIGLAMFAMSSAAAALSGSIGVLIATRILQGASGALILPIGVTIVSTTFPAKRRASAIGVLDGVTGLAVIVLVCAPVPPAIARRALSPLLAALAQRSRRG